MADQPWHPIMNAVEPEPGVWRMTAQYDVVYAEIRLVRRGPELGYRAVWWRDDGRAVVTYYRSLAAAAKTAHRYYLSTLSAGTPPPEHPMWARAIADDGSLG